MPDPAYRWVPEYRATFGDIAAQVGTELGMPPDEDQQDILNAIFAENQPGVPACFEVQIVAPRRNIKTSTLEIAALTDLFVLGVERHMWTAHLFKTSREAFEHMVGLIESHDDFRRRCRKPRTAHGDEAIELLSGQRIEFHARSAGGGRGRGVSKLTLDEGLYLTSAHLGAMVPTLATLPDAQIRHGSSAGLVQSDALRRIRDRGRAGGERRLAYFEWAAPVTPCKHERCAHELGADGCALDDRELWALANPALGRRISMDALEDQRRSLPPREFAREFLSWWEDPPTAAGGALDVSAWLLLADVQAAPTVPVAFGVDVAEDRTTSIGAAWRRPDNAVQVMITQDEHVDVGLSPAAAVERLRQLHERWGGTVRLGGPAVALETDLQAAGVPCVVVSSAEFAAASGRVADLLKAREVRHGNQPELNEAIRAAQWRSVGTAGERAFQLKDNPAVSPLAAVTRAVHGLSANDQAPPNLW